MLHRHNARYSAGRACGLILMMACSPSVLAAENEPGTSTWERLLDAANPYASVGYTYDSNLLRLDNDTVVPDGHSDRYATMAAGFDSDFSVSRQDFELSGRIFRNLYDTYDDLDYTGGQANAVWNWNTSGILSGDVGYQYKKFLRNFGNQVRTERVKDLRSEDRYFAGLDVNLPGSWELELDGAFADVSFSSTEALDIQRQIGGAALNYVSRSGNKIGFAGEFIHGEFDSFSARDYDEYFVGPTLFWQISATLQLSGRLGYTNRDRDDPLLTDYDDITGRIVVKSVDADRDRLTVNIWRELSNLGDEIAEFTLSQGVSVEPRWPLSNKVLLRGLASYEDRDFEGGLGPDADRQDDVYTGGVFADWEINRNITLSLGLDAQKRSSSRDLQDYNFHEILLQVTGRL